MATPRRTPLKSALKTTGSSSKKKRVRFADAPETTPETTGTLVYQDFQTVSRKRLKPLFNIPTTGTPKKAQVWGEAWPTEQDDNTEWVYEWFCDECDATIPDGAQRYECATCPDEYCRCTACYRASVIAGDRHPHPLVPSSKPFHITSLDGTPLCCVP